MLKTTRPLRFHLIALVAAAVVPVIVFGVFAVVKLDRQERTALHDQLEEKAVQLALSVENHLQQTVTALEVLALSNAVRQEDFANFHGLATRLVAANRGWSNVQLLGPNGEHLVNARVPYGAPLPPLLRPDLPREVAIRGRPFVSDMVEAVLARRQLTVVYVPVLVNGAARFVLAAATEPPEWRTLVRMQLLSGFNAVLLDRADNVVSSTFDGAGVPDDPGLPSARRTLPQSGWTVAVYHTRAASLSWTSTILPLLAGFAGLLTVGLLLAIMLGGRISRAMQRHADSVRAVGSGGSPLPAEGTIAEIQNAHEALEEAARLLSARWTREQGARAAIEQADRAKEDFIALLSHELRTPIATTLNALALLGDARAGKEHVAQVRGVIERQTRQMARLVDDLLDVARISRGKMALRWEIVDLNELIVGVASDHRVAMSNAGLEFAVQPAPAPVRVHGDPARLTQIMGNLLHNAAKFTPIGGRVTLALALGGDGNAEITVRDTGEGIEPDLLQSLFDPFVQGAQGRKSAKGLGVGLALVKSLAELHGGQVRAHSDGVGRGAQLTVTLPTVQTSMPAPAARAG